jgi:Fe-S-cluster containining protein
VRARFEAAVKRMEQAGLLDPSAPRGRAALSSAASSTKDRWEDVSHRYFTLAMPCPFLEDEACGVYPERPMACREYHVTTPAELCTAFDPGLQATPRPIRMGDVLTRLTNEALGRRDHSVPLPLALEWAGVHRRAFDRGGDGEELAMALVRHIQETDDAGP